MLDKFIEIVYNYDCKVNLLYGRNFYFGEKGVWKRS